MNGYKPCKDSEGEEFAARIPNFTSQLTFETTVHPVQVYIEKKKECPQSSEKPGASPSLSQPQSLRGQPHFAPCMQNDLTDGVQGGYRAAASTSTDVKEAGRTAVSPPFTLGSVLKNTLEFIKMLQ